ncbi:ricin B lectin domain-containing protein, partial [Mycena leptocephala]
PSANSAKCFTAASNTDGAAVEIEDCISGGSTSQNWTISGSTLQVFGTKCLDVTNGATTNGNKMQIWTCASGNTNQLWTVSGTTIQWSGHSSWCASSLSALSTLSKGSLCCQLGFN